MLGRPRKHLHSLLQKEKELQETLHRILLEEIAHSLSPNISRLSHLYGLPKTHNATQDMRPILSATETYNDNLAEWLEEKLKPLFINEYTVTDAFAFADEIRTHSMNDEDILVSGLTLYNLHSSLTFTMELSAVNEISFIGIEIVKYGTKLEAQV
ncbi:unnamed protein product, partial [Pocillopora meandrina]